MAEKKFKIGDNDDVTFKTESGNGLKECKACASSEEYKDKQYRFLAAATAKKVKKCHCGTEFEFKKQKKVSVFNGLSVTDYKLILTLAENVKEGATLAKPSVDRPTADDYYNQSEDVRKELDVAQLEWKIYDRASAMTKKQKENLTTAAKEHYGIE